MCCTVVCEDVGTGSALLTCLLCQSWQGLSLSISAIRAEGLAVGFSHVICWFACTKESLCAHCIWAGLQEPVAGCAAESCDVSSLTQKPGDHLSCDGLSHLVGCLFLLLCCRRVLLWKRRGSITMCPHTPQRPRAEASINLLSLCRAYRPCL